MSNIRLAGIEPMSMVDGPGIRYTIFVQGCIWNCPGCHNPETHNTDGGYLKDIDEIIDDISNYPGVRGITLSGGDPLYRKNREPVFELCKKYKEKYPDKTIWLYTGYEWDIISDLEGLKYIDVLVDGKFKEDLKSFELKFRGSSNQRLIDVKKTLDSSNVCEFAL